MSKIFLMASFVLSAIAISVSIVAIITCLPVNNQGYVTSDKIGVEYSSPLTIYPQIDKASSGDVVELFFDYGLQERSVK